MLNSFHDCLLRMEISYPLLYSEVLNVLQLYTEYLQKPSLNKRLLFYKDWSDIPAWINLISFIFVCRCAYTRCLANAYVIKQIKSLPEIPRMSLMIRDPFPFWPSSEWPKVPHTWKASLGETSVPCLGVTVTKMHLWFISLCIRAGRTSGAVDD